MRTLTGIFLLSFLSAGLPAQATVLPIAPPKDTDLSKDALIVQRVEVDIRYAADGTGERTITSVMKPQNEAGASALSVLALSYASAFQSAEFRHVIVHKADGRTVETPASDAIETPSAVTREAPMYSDLKVKQLPIRGLTPGDTLEYTAHYVTRLAQAPNQFWDAENFLSGVAVQSETYSLHVPTSKYVQVWSPRNKPQITNANGETVYRWTHSNLTPASVQAKQKESMDEEEKLPDIVFTTFKSWPEVGAWYRSLALERASVTPELKEQAAKLIAGAKTPEEQVKALYSYVSTQTRYVGISLGIGRYQPHTAMDVLNNQYGDCKDKDTLLEALLHAAGFQTAPALIGADINIAADVPSPAFFNHVITTVNLPTGQIWLDTTPGLSPYRYLTPGLRDKKALVIPATGDAQLQTTPANPPFPITYDLVADGSLDTESSLTAKIQVNYRMDDEVLLRDGIRAVSLTDWDQLAQSLSQAMGYGGTTTQAYFSKPTDTETPLQMHWDYKRTPFGNVDTHQIVPLFPASQLPYYEDKEPPKKAILLGTPRTETAVSRITLPKGWGADLPNAIHVKTPFATFDKTYRFENGLLTCDRKIVVLQKKLPLSEWPAYKDFIKKASLDSEAWILLMPSRDSTPGQEATRPSALDQNSPRQQAQMLAEASIRALQTNNRKSADDLFKQAKAISPDAPTVHAAAAMLAMKDNKMEEAERELQRDIEINPDDPESYLILATLQNFQHHGPEAQATLKKFLAGHPDENAASIFLANLQSEAGHADEAAKTIQAALKLHPDAPELTSQLPIYLAASGQDNAAVDSAKKIIATSDEPTTLNNAADILSNAGKDLPMAEQAARKALEMLETESAAAHIAEANGQSFAHATLMIASWDTLGWILFQQGKTQSSLEYLQAAWNNSYHAEVGYHLGKALEPANPKEAIKYYRWALGSLEGSKTQQIKDKLNAAVDSLKQKGVPETSKNATLEIQETRTFYLSIPHKGHSYATFRLQLGATGVTAVQFISGAETMRPLGDKLKTIAFKNMVPTESKGLLLRDGVLSCGVPTKCEFVLAPVISETFERTE